MEYPVDAQALELAREYIKERSIKAVEVGFADINGNIIGKRLPSRFLAGHMRSGTGLCRAPLTWDVQHEYFTTSKFAGFVRGASDMILVPDYATIREIPWRPGVAIVLSDLYVDDGDKIQPAPRQVLKNVLARLGKLGLVPKVGSEIEFYLLDGKNNPLFGGKQTYSLGQAGINSEIIDQIQYNLEGLGIDIEALHTEYGPGQMELILEYGDALESADNTILARNAIKEITKKAGLGATFMAQPWVEHSGSGFHLHQSLWDKDGKNLFDSDQKVLGSYASGLLKCASEFMALAAPTVNSYKRLVEMSFAPTKVGIGYDNRTVSSRLLGSGKSARIEHRTGSADANAYLLIAASLASGVHGLEQNLPGPELVTGNNYFNEALENLPRNLPQAADKFEASLLAPEYFGAEFVEIFSELIRFDIAAHHNAVSDWERDRYLENS
ncbi:MAG: glutamine synthetase family protein [Deltaproteobacteria bacterium]|jgi:glutamine synthetase|nr:glutamine synthetase family protein [Deltaproteobacteria bacterium]